jgi:hypothetical protein
LCARKRPALFPVRDRLVCELLGLSAFKNYQVDWQVFRHLMRDQQIVAAIDAMLVAVEATHTDRLVLDQPHLRLLDAAIWTYAKWDSS